jgi:protoporphyrinogen oxidase
LIEDARARGIRTARGVWREGPIVSTMQAPVFARLLLRAQPAYRDALAGTPYLGVVCPLLVLDRPFLGYWVLNLADSRVPFTGLIETTSFIDPSYVGGHHLVYLPKYTQPGSPWQTMSDDDITAQAIESLRRINPGFDDRAIRHVLVHRERHVEPLHHLGRAHVPPAVDTPIADLYLATTAQIYPALTNGESVTRHARMVADLVTERLASGHSHTSSAAVAV